MSKLDPPRRRDLQETLERYRLIRLTTCGLGNWPCTKVDLEAERRHARTLTEELGCEFVWPYNEPFDPAHYRRAPRKGCLSYPPPDPAGELRVGMVVLPEVVGPNGLTVAHAVVVPVC